jgi:hypothetical protein
MWFSDRLSNANKIARLRRAAAFTLVEVMVFSTILLLLMGCIALVLECGIRYLRLDTAYQDAQRQNMVGMRKVLEELGQTTTVRRQPPSPLVNSDYVIVMSPRPLPPDTAWTYSGSNLLYHQWLCFYRDSATQELVRATLPIAGGPTISADAPTAPPLASFRPPVNGTSQVLARGVTEFLVNDGVTGQQLSLRMTSAVATNSQKNTVITNRSVVTLPNP